jgi:nucleoside-diphosphate-sugar epimerase
MILITGYSGNTGSIVTEKLLKYYESSDIVGIARKNSGPNKQGIYTEKVSLEDKSSIERIMNKYEINSIIHIANIKYSPMIMEIAQSFNVEKVVLVHTTGIYSKYREYSKNYIEIENSILNNESSINHIILRPTMIYGNHRDYNLHKLIKFINTYPLIPVFGKGEALLQPVYVNDLADAIVNALNSKDVFQEQFIISGGSKIRYIELLKLISRQLNKKVTFFHLPLKLSTHIVGIFNKYLKVNIVSVEQVNRLMEDKTYPHDLAVKKLNYNPISIEEGIRREIDDLKQKKIIK